jgi:hypothetical protein
LKKRPFVQRKISRLVIHPDYNKVESGSDIALIKLDVSISFQHNIMPICLPTISDNFDGEFKTKTRSQNI